MKNAGWKTSLSYWVSVTFQVRTVSFREGSSSTSKHFVTHCHLRQILLAYKYNTLPFEGKNHHRTFRLPATRSQPLGKPRLTPCIAAAAPDFASAMTMNCENGMFLVEFFEVNRDKSVFGPWSVQHCMSVLDWFGGFLSGQFIISP